MPVIGRVATGSAFTVALVASAVAITIVSSCGAVHAHRAALGYAKEIATAERLETDPWREREAMNDCSCLT